MRLEDLPTITASHLAKSIDLNHHGTLFAGRMAEWVVEAGFMTARAVLGCGPDQLVCASLDRLDFSRSVPKGATLVIVGDAAHIGRSSVTIHLEASLLGAGGRMDRVTGGFATFVFIDQDSAEPHGLVVEQPEDATARARWDSVVDQRRRARG
jgi:acyl-CoA hydrolase